MRVLGIAERANLIAAGRQLSTNLSLRATRASRHGEVERAAALLAARNEVADAVDANDYELIRSLVARHTGEQI